MARDFGISRAGFYYHFRDRSDLLQKMLEYWGTEFTEVVVNDPGLSKLNPEKQLLRIMEMILDHDLTRYDLAIRDWSKRDKKAAKMVRKVYQLRVGFLRGIFRELGFRGQSLEMRTRLFVCYHSWEHAMFADLPKAEKRKLLKLRHKFLVEK